MIDLDEHDAQKEPPQFRQWWRPCVSKEPISSWQFSQENIFANGGGGKHAFVATTLLFTRARSSSNAIDVIDGCETSVNIGPSASDESAESRPVDFIVLEILPLASPLAFVDSAVDAVLAVLAVVVLGPRNQKSREVCSKKDSARDGDLVGTGICVVDADAGADVPLRRVGGDKIARIARSSVGKKIRSDAS